jgi:hypothetical protein
MTFTEVIKKEARLRAHYRCYRIQTYQDMPKMRKAVYRHPRTKRDPNLTEVWNACYYLTSNFHPSTP